MSWIVNKMPFKALILFWVKKYVAFSSVNVLSVCNSIVLNIFQLKNHLEIRNQRNLKILGWELERRYQCCVKQMIWQLFMSKRADKFLIKVSHKNQRNPFFCPHQKIYAGFIIIVWAFSKQTMICKFKLEWKVPRSGLNLIWNFLCYFKCWLNMTKKVETTNAF